jgi:hypothetical protein
LDPGRLVEADPITVAWAATFHEEMIRPLNAAGGAFENAVEPAALLTSCFKLLGELACVLIPAWKNEKKELGLAALEAVRAECAAELAAQAEAAAGAHVRAVRACARTAAVCATPPLPILA